MGRPKGSKNKKNNKTTRRPREYELYEQESSFLSDMKKEIIGIIIITICVILGISVFYNTGSETLLGPIHAGLEYLFGWFAFVFPIIIIMYTIVVLSDEEKDFDLKYLFTILFVLSLISAYPALTAGEYFLEAIKYGGILGASVAWCLYHIAGTLGGYIILVSLSILSFIIFTKKSFFGSVYEGTTVAAESVRNSKERFESRFLSPEEELGYELEEDDEETVEETEEYEQEEIDEENKYDIKVNEDDDDEIEEEEEEIVEEPVKKEKKHFFRPLRLPRKKEEIKDYVEILGANETKDDILRVSKSKNEGIVDIGFWENDTKILSKGTQNAEYDEDEYEDEIDDEDIDVDAYNDDEYEYDDEDEYDEEEATEEEEDDDGQEVAEFPKNSNIVRTKSIKNTGRKIQIFDEDEKEETEEEEQLEIEEEEEEINYIYPSVKLLNKPSNKKVGNSKAELKQNAQILESTLQSFGVKAKVLDVTKGPAVTRYELQPERGVKVSKIVNLTDDIALNLAAAGVRIEAPIPGKAAIGIEIANKESTSVLMREVLDTPEFQNAESRLSVCLGKGIDGKPAIIDLAKMPHLLIAGATGSGKSVCINSIISSIIYKSTPSEVKILMIDPKVVELKMYTGIPHLLIPVVTNPKKAASALSWAVSEMLERYKFFADNNVKDLKGFNALMEKQGKKKIPQIVIIIDELADLMMSTPKEVEDSICRLAQMARAAGMHLIIATQRPSVDVITGLIKANIPSRIAFAVSSQIDSRTILDIGGAEKLLGKGDMLYFPVGANKPTRIQGAFISETEVEKVVDFIKDNHQVEYSDEMIEAITARNLKDANSSNDSADGDEGDDDLIDDAIDLVREKKKASISMFQRAFRIGYNRAARLMDDLEDKGVVGPEEGTKPRRVLLENIDYDD